MARGRHELRVHRVLGAPPGANAEQTGWATAPGESVLRPLAGWAGQDEVRALHGTAFTQFFVALAVLGTETDDLVASATAEGAEVRRPDGFTVWIRFGPPRVCAGLSDRDQGDEPLSRGGFA